MNRYMYVEGNPVRWSDRSGHRKIGGQEGALIGYVLASQTGSPIPKEYGYYLGAYMAANQGGHNSGSAAKDMAGGARWAGRGIDHAGRWALKNTANAAKVTGEQWEEKVLRRRHPNERWGFDPVSSATSSGIQHAVGVWLDSPFGELLKIGPLGGIIFAVRLGIEISYDTNGKRPRKENKFGTAMVIYLLLNNNIGDIQGHANNLANETGFGK